MGRYKNNNYCGSDIKKSGKYIIYVGEIDILKRLDINLDFYYFMKNSQNNDILVSRWKEEREMEKIK